MDPSMIAAGPTRLANGVSAVPVNPIRVCGAIAPLMATTHRMYSSIALACAAITPQIKERPLGSRWRTVLAQLLTEK